MHRVSVPVDHITEIAASRINERFDEQPRRQSSGSANDADIFKFIDPCIVTKSGSMANPTVASALAPSMRHDGPMTQEGKVGNLFTQLWSLCFFRHGRRTHSVYLRRTKLRGYHLIARVRAGIDEEFVMMALHDLSTGLIHAERLDRRVELWLDDNHLCTVDRIFKNGSVWAILPAPKCEPQYGQRSSSVIGRYDGIPAPSGEPAFIR